MYDDDVPVNDLGQLANLVRERINGNFAYYNINTHLNATNVCVLSLCVLRIRSDLRSPKAMSWTIRRSSRGARKPLTTDAPRCISLAVSITSEIRVVP